MLLAKQMFHPANLLWLLTSLIFFDKLSLIAPQSGAKHSMANKLLLLSNTANNLEQVVHLVDSGKLESGL